MINKSLIPALVCVFGMASLYAQPNWSATITGFSGDLSYSMGFGFFIQVGDARSRRYAIRLAAAHADAAYAGVPWPSTVLALADPRLHSNFSELAPPPILVGTNR